MRRVAATTIQVKNHTRDLLRAIAGKGETYDEIIYELIEVREAYLENLLRIRNEGKFIPLEEALREIERSTGSRSSGKTQRVR